MAEIIQDPELRYTSENQTPIAEMLVQFPGSRPEDPPATLKVIGWGNLAQEIQANYHQGDRVVLEGRLGINTIDRPEGFKEKRVEMTIQRLHRLGTDTLWEAAAPATISAAPSQAAPDQTALGQTAPSQAPASQAAQPKSDAVKARSAATPKAKSPSGKFSAPPDAIPEANLDEIPF